jgi:hypothetical protein
LSDNNFKSDNKHKSASLNAGTFKPDPGSRGLYDPQNFEQASLQIKLRNQKFLKFIYSLKKSFKYDLFSNFAEIEVFLAIFKLMCQKLQVFGAVFIHFGWLEGYLPLLTPSTATFCPGIPPANYSVHQAVSELPSWSLALSK